MKVSDLDLMDLKRRVSGELWNSSEKYRNKKDKLLHLSSRILLNYLLMEININDPTYSVNEYGKPYLNNHSNIHFNISHSEEYVFCAVSESPIGVDIECLHDVDLDIAKNYFHNDEYQYIINSSEKNEAFFKIWVLKESYLKMKGFGLNLDLDSFVVDMEEMSISIVNDETINLKLWNIGDNENKYFLAACALETIPEIKSITYEEILGKIYGKNK